MNALRFLHLLTGLSFVRGAYDISLGSDLDLTRFVTRPEIKAPLFNVTVNRLDQVAPGYWFIAPYTVVSQEKQARNYYQACQTGPAIYDNHGELVWSGACHVQNQNTFDFRVAIINGSEYLTRLHVEYQPIDTRGRGVIMDSSYRDVLQVETAYNSLTMDMHEFNIIEDGRTALFTYMRPALADLSDLGNRTTVQTGWVFDQGFVEVDLVTGKQLFEWTCLPHVPLGTSRRPISGLDKLGWNYFHINSIEKMPSGDYMISSRFTDCIYLVSKLDGSVLWRLGGAQSSFVLDGFNFSRQHDPRIISQNSSTTVISFLDNAGDGIHTSSSVSTAYILALETAESPMRARVVRSWSRPGGKISESRGNLRILPNGNAFAGWSDHAHLSEHTPEGELVLNATLQNDKRFVTYRTYKFNFTGKPAEPPTVRSFIYGVVPGQETTVLYVSWNGATEVDRWVFYQADEDRKEISKVGSTKRTGFETMFQVSGAFEYVLAEAIDANGDVLGMSELERSVLPGVWSLQDAEKTYEAQRKQQSSATVPKLVAWNRNTALLPKSIEAEVTDEAESGEKQSMDHRKGPQEPLLQEPKESPHTEL